MSLLSLSTMVFSTPQLHEMHINRHKNVANKRGEIVVKKKNIIYNKNEFVDNNINVPNERLNHISIIFA